MWHVVSVTSRMELDTVARINSGGFIAHCPTYQKKYRAGRRSRIFLRTRIEPLFTGYIFVRADAAFRKDKFETSKVRLMVFRKQLLSEDEMERIKMLAEQLTAAQDVRVQPIPIKRHEVLQIIHGDRMGDRVKAIEVLRERIKVEFLDRPEWQGRPAWINRTSLGRAV